MRIPTKRDLFSMSLQELQTRKNIILRNYFKTENRIALNVLFDILAIIDYKKAEAC